MSAFVYFEVEENDEFLTIRLANPVYFDVVQYGELRDELIDFVERQRPKKLLVDFSAVRYCSTAVIHTLLIVKNRLDGYGGQLKFCRMNDVVRESFERLNLVGTVKRLEVIPAPNSSAVLPGQFGSFACNAPE